MFQISSIKPAVKFLGQFVFLVFVSAAGAYSALAQTTITPPDASLTLKVGDESQPIPLKLNDNSAAKIGCKVANAEDSQYVEITNPSEEATTSNVKVKAKKLATDNSITLKCAKDEAYDNGIEVVITNIKPAVETSTLAIDGSTVLTPASTEINLLAGQTLDLTITDGVTLSADATAPFTVSFVGGKQYKITGKKDQQGSDFLKAVNSKLKIPVNGTKDFKVNVAQVKVKPTLNIGKSCPSNTAAGTPQTQIEGDSNIVSFIPSGFVPTIPLNYISDKSLVFVNQKTLCGAEFGTTKVIISSAQGGIFEIDPFTVNVVSTIAKLRITPPDDIAVYVDGGRMILNAQALSENNELLSPQPIITWSLETNSDKEFVNLPASGSTISLTALKVPSDASRTIVIQASTPNVPSDTIRIFVRGKRNVVDFKPIKVRIDMVDQRTAEDLFGKPASKEYHIAKIHIVNDLTAPQGGGAASSILFFSDSLEVRVALEKKIANKKQRKRQVQLNTALGTNAPVNGWNAIETEDIYYVNNWKYCNQDERNKKEKLLGDYNASGISACESNYNTAIADCVIQKNRSIENNTDKNLVTNAEIINAQYTKCVEQANSQRLLCRQQVKEEAERQVYGGDDSIDFANRESFCDANLKIPDPAKPTLYPSGAMNIRNGQWIPFRPFIYQVVANTHDRRDARSLRSKIFMGANVLGAGTSFFTSFLTLRAGNDLPAGLDKFQNLLLPTMEKLFPSMREVQRQNIISEILPPLVEVPFGSDVSKYVFFPKKGIDGVLPNYQVRISSISSYNITVKVGIVQKGNVQQTP